ncbi:hypothetical protein [Mesorhizobium sp.]|uniref:hypothetical protein n=1 Tax=Mesorhizobium sp. TaxID=1871066 RepID=UPI000FE477EA|nr:hypothetical protein [Mesorhizobium sp.]RWB66558.1 MAG: hypothetical protein EOQ49_28110 [Mesorhizobium sp.]
MKLQKLAGATSEIWQVFIRDSSSTTGGGLTGLTNASSGLTAYYHRDTDTTATAISLASMTVGTFTSSGFKEIDATNMPGWYQFCPPNAALAAGAKSCAFHLKGASNMAPLPIEVQLLAVNVDDAVRMGMSALPNANAEAAGGLYTRGSGAGQINQDANGRIDVNLKAILGTVLTETAGQIAAGFKKLFDVASPAFTLASINQTGDNYARLGAPAGASVSADIAAVKSDSGSIKTKTDSLTFTVAGMVDSNVVDWKGATAPAMTGDAYARLGAPVGASISADIAGVQSDTDNIQTRLPAALVGGRMDSSIGAVATGVIAAASFASGALDAVWSTTTRLLTAGTNIVLAKGTGVTGFNDLDTAGVRGAVGMAAANLDTQLAAIDADVLTRSTYAGTDTAGTTTLLSRLTATRAGYLDNLSAGAVATAASITALPQAVWDALTSALTTVGSIGKLLVDNIDAAISSRSTYAGADTAGTTTLLGRLTSTRAGLLDNLDAAVSTRLATSGYTAPDNAGIAAIETTLGTPGGASIAADIAAVPTASENAAAVLAETYEGSETVQDHLRLSRAALVGKANGLATTTAHYRDAADTKNRITATVDADGNRSAVTTDAT